MPEEKKTSKGNQKIPIEGKKLRERNSFHPDIRAGEFSDYGFRYYTRLARLKSIIGVENKLSGKGNYFFASNYKGMNDVDEAKSHSDEKEMVHALCFSNSDSESIPMWYLYSGIFGRGACLRITAQQMLTFIKNIQIVYPVDDNNTVDTSNPLKVGEQIELQPGWVYYYDGKEIFFRNEWYKLTDECGSFFSGNYFLKKYPWHYEREFRIVLINKSDTAYKRLAIPIGKEILESSKTKIILAPEYESDDELTWLPEQIKNNVKSSDLKVSMDLYRRNEREINEFISEAVKTYIQLKEKKD